MESRDRPCVRYQFQDETTSYYEALSVSENAEYAEIRGRYRAAALALHPDKADFQGGDLQHEGFVKIQRAWEILSDREARAAYDTFLLRQRTSNTSDLACKVISEVVVLDEMEEVDGWGYVYPCRCGDGFSISAQELQEDCHVDSRQESCIKDKTPQRLGGVGVIYKACASCDEADIDGGQDIISTIVRASFSASRMHVSNLLRAVLKPCNFPSKQPANSAKAIDAGSRPVHEPKKQSNRQFQEKRRSPSHAAPKMTCLCAPTTHPGSFRCRLHRIPRTNSAAREMQVIMATSPRPIQKVPTDNTSLRQEVPTMLWLSPIPLRSLPRRSRLSKVVVASQSDNACYYNSR